MEGPAAKSKPRMTFIDDDENELRPFREKVESDYCCQLVHWPRQYTDLFGDPPPDIFVSDLYLPPTDDTRKPSQEEMQEAKTEAQKVTKLFEELYERPRPELRSQRSPIKNHQSHLGSLRAAQIAMDCAGAIP